MVREKKDSRLKGALRLVIFGVGLAFLAYGCASVPVENPALTSAKAAYEKATKDPKVATNAAVPLYEAGQTLKRAEAATGDAETSHLAYMSEKQTAIAVATAEQRAAEMERESLAKERNQILLEQQQRKAREARGEAQAMTQEADRQRMTAEARAREAEAARALAESRRLEAEKATREAEMRKMEMEQARKEAEIKTAEALEARKRAEAASMEAKGLEQELADLKAKKTDRGFVLTLGDVLFATAKADLMPGAHRTIDRLAAFLNKYPDRKVVVEGHTDSRGSEAYNMALSLHRAESVQAALKARGISADRITVKGLGELYPVASNAKAAGRQQNRRVEIVISSNGQAPAPKKE